MAILLTSDAHFGHRVAALDRGFSSVADHDAAIVNVFQRMVQPRDEVWWLGDMAFDGWLNRLTWLMPSLPGTHRLILGNHDRGHPLHSNGHSYLHHYLEVGFASVATTALLRHNGRNVLLSHFPYDGDHTEAERHSQWRLRDEGDVLVHGHTHSTDKLTFSAAGTPQIHVGFDAWRRPVTLGEAMALLND